MKIIDTINDRVLRNYTKEDFLLDEWFSFKDREALRETLITKEPISHTHGNPQVYGFMLTK